MKNEKGFTLVELLAVIVILGVILVIAVPQVMNVIKNSKDDAWDDSVSLIKRAIELKTSISNNSTSLSRLCKSNETDTTEAFKTITDVGEIKISCTSSSPYTFVLRGTDKYKNKTKTLTCTSNGKCE